MDLDGLSLEGIKKIKDYDEICDFIHTKLCNEEIGYSLDIMRGVTIVTISSILSNANKTIFMEVVDKLLSSFHDDFKELCENIFKDEK